MAKKATKKKNKVHTLNSAFSLKKADKKFMIVTKETNIPCTTWMTEKKYNDVCKGIDKKDMTAILQPYVLRKGRFLRLIGK